MKLKAPDNFTIKQYTNKHDVIDRTLLALQAKLHLVLGEYLDVMVLLPMILLLRLLLVRMKQVTIYTAH